MADKNIGALPQAPQLDDDSLLVAEQQGQAMKVTGAQFKEFGRQAVIGQVQEYVDQAEDAANRALEAVSAVTEMTVESKTLGTGQPAEVSKTIKEGKVHLTFGLPRGEQGVPGPEGQTGPRGPQGPPGAGLEILGYYGTLPELEAAVPNPEPGDAYGVGSEAPYDIYVFDGVSNAWKNNGPLTGGGGGSVLPEDVVTSVGGASFLYGAGAGEAPHVIEFNFEEEPPLTAGDITYGNATLQEAVEELFSSVSDGKQLIASAVTDKGVPTAQDATFSEMAENIGQISSGADTSDATATPGDILAPKTAYTAAGKVEGIVPTLPARTITPGTAPQTIANGQYLGGTQTIQGDTNLTSNNIRKGVSIFGVAGAMESSFQATLTVKADTGAVVTAKNGDTEVSALSTNGQVVLDLPIEGTWKVTAQRGMAQYNTVVIEVTSSYHAELTAEVHVEYYMEIGGIRNGRRKVSGASIADYALFIGGIHRPGYSDQVSGYVDSYDKNLTRIDNSMYLDDTSTRDRLSASTKKYIFTACSRIVDVISEQLSHDAELELSNYSSSSTAIDEYALFFHTSVDVFSSTLERTEATPLPAGGGSGSAAAANSNYAIVAGGYWSGKTNAVGAYDKNLTRVIPTSLSEARSNLVGVRAGNYVLFCGGINSKGISNMVDAYDLFLTRTTPQLLNEAKVDFGATTLNDLAVIAGGRIKISSTNELNGTSVESVEAYDPFLVKTDVQGLSKKRYFLGAATIENYALFGGGYTPSVNVYTVDVYRYV